MLGFGPSGISLAPAGPGAVKVMNPDGAAYVAAVARDGPFCDRAFGYGLWDLRVFSLTRRPAALEISRDDGFLLSGTEVLDDFPDEFAALERERRVEVNDDARESHADTRITRGRRRDEFSGWSPGDGCRGPMERRALMPRIFQRAGFDRELTPRSRRTLGSGGLMIAGPS
jgi:hypothetical protein